jgi:hypothetical protein
MRVFLWLAILFGPARAFAEQAEAEAEPPVFASLVAGAGVAFGSLAVGGLQLATVHEGQASRKPGAYTILYGITLSPIISHAISGEWERAALFGAIPLTAAISATWLIETSPSLLIEGGLGKRRALTLCYSLALLSAAVGLFDSMKAGERARTRRLALAPWGGRGELGLAVGGWL